MDVARTLIAIIFIWAINLGPALAAPQSNSGPVHRTTYFAGQSGDWSSAGPITAPTISASPNTNDRYAYPPASTQPAASPRQSRSARASSRTASQQVSPASTTTNQGYNQQYQNWNSTAPQPIQPIGSNPPPAAQPAFSTNANSSQSSNPWVTAPAAPTTSSSSHGSVGPPPSWPTVSPTTPSAPTWNDSATPIAIADRSVLTTPATTQNGNAWSSIGSSVAAPPLITPQLPASNNSTAPPANTAGSSDPPFPAGSYRDQPTIHSPLVSPAQLPTTPAAGSAAPASDDWTAPWSGNAEAPRATIGRSGNSSTRVSTRRESELAPFPPLAQVPQESGKSATSTDNPWKTQPQSFPEGSTATKATSTAAGNNTLPPTLPPGNSPILNSPAVGSTGNSVNSAGQNPNATQPATGTNAAKPNPSATLPTGQQQPWVPMIAAVLSLAGSLAANLFLGWSYLDARQKYQSLVRRTADTFRRVKAAAA